MTPYLFFGYGLVAYGLFLVAFLYAIGFVGNTVVPKSVDSGAGGLTASAILINSLLLGAFAVQHAIMARPWFKERWTKLVPQPVERSTFVAVASLLLLLAFWQWRGMSGIVWQVENSAGRGILQGLFVMGWVLVLYASFLIDHFDLFGLRQVYLHLKGKEYTHPGFATPTLYRFVRNPLMLGFLMAFWATPVMTQGHLLFSILTTAYIFIGVTLEERDLLRVLGEDYKRYREQTPMIIPLPWKRLTAPRAADSEGAEASPGA